MTDAETLRRAAHLIRERATQATPGPWESLDNGDRLVAWRVGPGGFDDDFEYVTDEPISNAANAAHIAGMHPGVAQALADWLDAVADRYDALFDTFAPGSRAGAVTAAENVTASSEALRVARTILGDTP